MTGAGATGKSSVIDELKTLSEKSFFQSSITRGFYKSKNIENEIVLQSYTEQEKKQFQFDMLDYYLTYTLEQLSLNKDKDCFIDRSPIDYLAWTLYVSPNLTNVEYSNLIKSINNFFIKCCEIFKTHICEFPYPAPWQTKTTHSSDGFRYDPFGKNLVISSIIKDEINKLLTFNSELRSIRVPAVYFNNVVVTPNERAVIVLTSFKYKDRN